MIKIGFIFLYGCIGLLFLGVVSLLMLGVCLYIIHLFATTYLGLFIFIIASIVTTLYLMYMLGSLIYEATFNKRLENTNKTKYKNKKKFSEDLIELLKKSGYTVSSSNLKDYEILYVSKSNFIHEEDIGLVCYVHRIIFKNGEISDEIYEISNYDLMFGQFDKYELEVNLHEYHSVKDYMKNELEKNKEKCFKEYREAFINREEIG